MRSKTSSKLMLAAAALALVAGATDSRADSCSASTSSLITRSAGGTCGDALSADQIFTLTYRITNQSIIDGGPNDGVGVDATIQSGNEIVSILAQDAAGVGETQLPGVLTFVPVCDAGSSMNAGLACDPNAPNCGTGNCGCATNLPGVTCVANGNNRVDLLFGSDVAFTPGQQRTIATIQVQSTGTTGATCGEYFARMDSTGDIMETTDTDCESTVTAGAQASADLHAPECASDEDCGDTDCNVCADLGTANHCEPANLGSSCGTDGDPDDCVLPACIDNNGTGECSQGELNEAEGAACDDDGVDCTEDACDDGGSCLHTVSDAFCDDQDQCTDEFCSAQLGCVYDFICEGTAICRSPGYWATHSGTEKDSVNVGQLVIDAVGPIEVCGQSITSTSGDGLSSSLEGLCMKTRGVKQRQLYRQLVAAAFNCAISGGDCETVSGQFVDVSFDDCSDLCAGTPVVDGPTIGECIGAFDCFNNGGQLVNGTCTYDLPGNCHEATICNEEIGVCPKSGPASSSTMCKSVKDNGCTIDSCP